MDARLVVAALVIPLAAPLVAAGENTEGCNIHTYPWTTEVAGYYMAGTAWEFWQESNDVPGLQRGWSRCDGGRTIPADTCITHSEDYALINCVVNYVL